jgi:hypothetical protein
LSDVEDLDLSGPLEALISCIVDDLPRHGGALVRLLARASGAWVGFDEIVRGDATLSSLLRDATEPYGVSLLASWLPAPSPNGDERVVVTVYSPEWNGIAGTILFDRDALVAAQN